MNEQTTHPEVPAKFDKSTLSKSIIHTMKNVGINLFGRIGRLVFRAIGVAIMALVQKSMERNVGTITPDNLKKLNALIRSLFERRKPDFQGG